ncbi:MAG: DUF6434 domain-containing protein [Polyangiaceae bacterium]
MKNTALRPRLSRSLREQDFRRWYWTLEELRRFARTLGVSASGPKADVAERIAAALSGRRQPASVRSATADQLCGALSPSTLIPPNQRATQELRRYFEAKIGKSFRFNGHMRALLGRGNVTLEEAVAFWHATVNTELPPQSESLEFNRFTKAWHRAHPDGTPGEARAAWLRYRALPADERPPVAEA